MFYQNMDERNNSLSIGSLKLLMLMILCNAHSDFGRIVHYQRSKHFREKKISALEKGEGKEFPMQSNPSKILIHLRQSYIF